MSKGDFPALRMTIDGGRLVPAGQFDAERLNSYRRGTVVYVRFTEEKDRVLVRKWWAILGLVVKQCETPWKTKEEASEAVKLALGIVNLSKTVGGQFMQYPKSLKDLEDPEMSEALEQMTELLSRMTGVDVETLKKETAHVGSEPDNSDSDSAQLPGASETGDGSPAEAPEEPGEVSPEQSPGSRITDAEWLQTAARMLWAATNVGADTEANLSVLNAQRLAVGDLCPSDCPQPIKDKAGSIYRQCKAVVMSEVEKPIALKFVAGIAGTTEKELAALPSPSKPTSADRQTSGPIRCSRPSTPAEQPMPAAGASNSRSHHRSRNPSTSPRPARSPRSWSSWPPCQNEPQPLGGNQHDRSPYPFQRADGPSLARRAKDPDAPSSA